MKPILEINHLEVVFQTDEGKIVALDDINIQMNKGEIVGLVGESGSGKSITSLSIMDLIPSPPGKITRGSILFDNKDLLQLSERSIRKIRGNDISMIFQEPMTSLNPVYTIGRQIDEAFLLHQDISKKAARKQSIALLDQVGIPRSKDIVYEYPHNLSGGMRQRVLIAIAMACEPQIIIADEPTTALDVTMQAQILNLLIDLQKQKDLSVLFVTHDLGVVAEICQKVIVMYAGQIVEKADVVDLFKHPKHPYTAGLINSIPSLTEKKEVLDSIPGQAPSPLEYGKGCRFAPRCFQAQDKCFTESPLLEQDQHENTHEFRCWFPLKEEQDVKANLIR